MDKSKLKVTYGEKTVELSRLYPFGETQETSAKKSVTVLRLQELNGHDNVAILAAADGGKHMGYLQVAASAGIDYDEALMLADKDFNTVVKALDSF